MSKTRMMDDLQILGGPTAYEAQEYEPEKAHLQEVTRAYRHLSSSLNSKSEDEFVDNVSAAIFHLERVKQSILDKPIPIAVKITTIKIPYE